MISQFNKYVQSEDILKSKSEALRYLAEPIESRDDKFDLLNCWKGKCVKHPIISSMARDVLAIPISTVNSKSVFSTGVHILDPFRSSLAPQMVKAPFCAQNWLWDDDSTQQTLEDVEKFENAAKDGCAISFWAVISGR